MPRARKKPAKPFFPWDHGPQTAAQNRMKVIEGVDDVDPETGEKRNANNVKRARRIDMAEVYFKRGIIERRQFLAAMAYREAWERTMRSPPAINPVRVDSSPKPDQHVDVILTRLGKFHQFAKLVTGEDVKIIERLCIHGCGPGHSGMRYYRGLEKMKHALDRLADRMGL